jgi:membrane protein implicated in regulation of membrane protease activity
MKKTRLVITIITNIIWEALIIGAAVWGLPLLGIHLPLWAIVIITIAFAIYAAGLYWIGNRIIDKKILPGSTDMVGVKGRVIKRLAPSGVIQIEGELWEAKVTSGTVEAGTEVLVTGQKGLKLEVRAEL